LENKKTKIEFNIFAHSFAFFDLFIYNKELENYAFLIILVWKEITVGSLLELKRQIYESLKNGEIEQADELANNALTEAINDSELDGILKIIKFWQNREKYFVFDESANNGEALFDEWDRFMDFCIANKIDNKKAVLAVKSYVFKMIVDMLIEYYRIVPVKDKETLILLGEAFYETGLIEKAIETLEYAMNVFREDDDVRIYLLLGDMYAETGDEELAMVMFGEAFFKFPQLVSLDKVDFPALHKLEKMICDDGFDGNEIVEWMPVYGYFYSGLTARRGIGYEEYLGLQNKIREYEKSLVVDKKVINIIIPRLINYYLWVFDYYVYQVRSIVGAKKIASRIFELLDGFPQNKKAVDKLKSRGELLFRAIIDKADRSYADEAEEADKS
jgi:tetratricopeptide (TPR) repeat protein